MSQWIAETLIATTLLMIAVLLLRRPVTERFGARVAYLLWLAPGLRMILPPLPSNWFPATAVPSALPAPDAATMVGEISGPAEFVAAAGGGVAWPTLSLSVWLGGAALFFAWHWLSYCRFARNALDDADYIDHDGPVPVAASRAISSPVALGIFGRRVLVPADFAHRYDADEQRLALDHELAHHRRLDLPVNLAALAMLSLHWFNPIAHIAHRAFRLDQESACDAIVLARADAGQRLAYGTALYKSATGAMPLAVCALGDASQLKSRLRLIVSGEASRAWMQCGGALTAVIVMMGLVITASSQVAAVTADRVEIEAPAIAIARAQASRAIAAAERRAAAAAIKADIAQRAAQVAERRSVRARANADRALRRSEIVQPALPVLASPPVSPLTPAPPAATAPITPVAPIIRVSRSCPGEQHAVATRVNSSGATLQTVRVALCRKIVSGHFRASTSHGLITAREEIANDPTIPAPYKAEIVADLDNQIKRLTIRYFTLQ